MAGNHGDDGDAGNDRQDLLTHAEWARALRDGDLRGQRCLECGHETAAPKAACVRCGERSLETITLPTEGTVVSTTTIAVAPTAFESPYQVAIVELGDARVLGRLEGDAEIGDRVTFVGALETGEDDGEPAPVFS